MISSRNAKILMAAGAVLQLFVCTGCSHVHDRHQSVADAKRAYLEPDEPAPAHSNGITVDDRTGLILIAQSNGVIVAQTQSGEFVSAVDDGKPIENIDARGGYVCASQPDAHLLSVSDLTRIASRRLDSTRMGTEPAEVWVTALRDEGPVCVVYDRSETLLWEVKIPSLKIVKRIVLHDLTAIDKLPPFQGGWRLTGFSSGDASGIAAVLSISDRKVALVDLYRGEQMHTVVIPGIPLQEAVDSPRSELIVAWWTGGQPITHFGVLNPRTGMLRTLKQTSALFPAGLQATDNGNSILVVDRENHAIIPLQ